MPEDAVVQLLRQAPFGFVGTIEHLGAATMTDVPIDERTAVVHVDHIVHAPPAFAGLEGHRITLRLRADAEIPQVGDTATFFAEGLAFGDSVAVAEVGRLPVDAVESHVTRALDAGQPEAFATLQRQVETERVREHVAQADAVVVGRVVRLEDAVRPSLSEHDPDWWKATLQVYHVERGNVQPGEVAVLYANSLDVRWRNSPKPRASQEGVWILHATAGDLRQHAPFQILHPEDYQPVEQLESLR